MRDVIILGGGPAAMTAAVYAARKQLDAVLLSKDMGGQVNWTLGVENYMGYQFIEGSELMEKFEEQVKHFPLETKVGPIVTSLKKVKGGFKVALDDGSTYSGKAVIVATGKRPRPLGVDGEEQYKGRGVTYCSICDGPMYTGQRVAVVGGGNSALEAVDDMLKIAEHIDLVSVTPLTGDQVLIDKVSSAKKLTQYIKYEVVGITGSKFVEGITIRNLETKKTKRLAVSGVFVEIGLLPNSDLVKDFVEVNEIGEIKINCSCETNVPGLYAAGDVTTVPEKQIVVAAGEGAKATLQAHRYLRRL